MTNDISWALCPWFEELGDSVIHTDDLEELKKLKPYGLIFKVVKEDANWIYLRFGGQEFRVSPSIVKQISPTAMHIFDVGEEVSIIEKAEFGKVLKVMWHYQKRKPMYTLQIEGKKKSKRYWPEELGALSD